MKDVEGVLAVAICDRNGLIITSEDRAEFNNETVIGVLSAVLDSYIERIKDEFGAQSNFYNITMTGDKKFVFCSQGPNTILTTIADPTISDIKLRVYSEHIASKVELLIAGNDKVSLEIPEIIRTLSKIKEGKLPVGEFTIKIILTGDFSVGKTSLIKRFVENSFQESYISTIGVEISKKTMEIGETTDISFLIWDIGGQAQNMLPYRQRFYSGANAAFIVIDRTREGDLNSFESWYNDIKKSVSSKIPIIIVANKSDLVNEICISEKDIKELTDKYGFHYILTSAKTGENVNDAFLYIAYRFLEYIT
jgi:small GTP-binding protein